MEGTNVTGTNVTGTNVTGTNVTGTNVTTVYHARLAPIINRIDADPSCWDQCVWHCGTAHCLAGHAQIDAGLPPNGATAAIDGAQWLGMSEAVSRWAFATERTLDDIRSLLTYNLSSEYNPHGFDRNGFDLEGYHRNGFDREGYNRDGFDPDGYDRDGLAPCIP